MFTMYVALVIGLISPDWIIHKPEGNQFRLALPSEPSDTTQREVTIAPGKSHRLTTSRLSTPNALYLIQITESRGRVNPDTFDEGIQHFAAARKATIGAQSTITVDGNPGREFEVVEQSSEGPKRSRMRWVASGNRLYMLTVSTQGSGELPAEANRFLHSLEIGPEKPDAQSQAVALAKTPTNPEKPEIEKSPLTETKPEPTPERAKADQDTASSKPIMESDPESEPDSAPEAEEKQERNPEPKVAEKEKSGSRKSSAPRKVTLSRLPRDAKPYPDEQLTDLTRSFLKTERDGFRDIGPKGSVLVGVRVSYIERFGGPKVRSAQPIYRLGTKLYAGRVYGEVVGPVTTVVAKPGYAVGGLMTHTGLTVDGFRMIFMKVDEDRLDPEDQYNSVWIGDVQGGGPGEVMSPGALVVGLQGRSGTEVFALGLTTTK